MGKKSKGEKLDHILSELQKLKGEIKSLGKQQAELAVQIDKLTPKKPAARAARKPAKAAKRSVPQARKAGAAPKRPMLVSPPDASGKAGAQ